MALRRLTVLAAAAPLLLAVAPAYAATGSPPVTNPDTATLHVGEQITVDTAANDTDPDGEPLQTCRIFSVPRQLQGSFVQDGQVVLVAGRRASGTFTLTYYACDTSYLAPGTLTVTILSSPASLSMKPSGRRHWRITNDYTQRTFRCRWKRPGQRQVLGRVTVPPATSVVIRAPRQDLMISCASRDADGGVAISVGVISVAEAAGTPGHGYSANASGGGQAQTRLRSP